jgi:hypothetical protein
MLNTNKARPKQAQTKPRSIKVYFPKGERTAILKKLNKAADRESLSVSQLLLRAGIKEADRILGGGQ